MAQIVGSDFNNKQEQHPTAGVRDDFSFPLCMSCEHKVPHHDTKLNLYSINHTQSFASIHGFFSFLKDELPRPSLKS